MSFPFVHDWFAATAADHSDSIAIDAGAETLTYSELERRANGLAHALVDAVPPGTLVGILTDDRVQVIAAMIATLNAGCAFVPMDPANGEARVATLVDEIDLAWWVADTAVMPRLSAIAQRSGRSFRVLCTDARGAATSEPGVEAIHVDLAAADRSPCTVPRDPDSLCYIYFTSGSTGRPKGIAGRLKAIDHFVRWEAQAVGAAEGTRFSQLTSPAFDAVLRDVFTPLCTAGVVCIPPDRDLKRHAFGLLEWLRRSRVNVVHCVPSVLRTLLQIPAGDCRLPELRHVLTSGEPLLPTDMRRWLPRFGDHARLTNLYGPSETTMIKFAYPVSPADAERPSIPIGKPIDGTRAIVLNEHGKVCPPGVVGEIYIRTPYRSLGYFRRPELTAEVFVPNPYGADPTDLIYRTGDLGRVMEDGNYEFLGRRDAQIKIRGVRVELAEVENALRRDPRVVDAAVIDRELEDAAKTLCAFVVLRDGLTIDALKAATADLLPEYMMPSRFVAVADVPRTVTGKVDRRAIEALAPVDGRGPDVVAAPRTPIEEIVAVVWARALGVERVGIHDNFFQDLGGHSLLATQVLARLQPLFDVPLKLRWMLQFPTVAGVGACIAQELNAGGADRAAEPPLEPVSRDQMLPASFAQERLWVVDHVTGTHAYHLPLTLRLTGELVPTALSSALTALVARHEALRTTFRAVDGRPVQHIAPPARVPMPCVDLSALSATERTRAERSSAASFQAAPFDLARGPLFRIAVWRLDERTHALSGVAHHIVADGWSFGVLLRDLAALYGAARTGDVPQLPPLPVQYADYAVWQRRAIDDAVIEREMAYWRTALAGVAPLELPTDRPRPPAPSGRGRIAWRRSAPALSALVPTWARAHGATTFMVLLAAWQLLLARYAGQKDVAVGVPVAQRSRPELEPLVGLFLNTLVLRTTVAGSMPWHALVATVRASALGAYAHQTLPFERVLQELQPERDLTRTPLFQVLFALHDLPAFSAALPALDVDVVDSEAAGAKFDLELGVRTEGDALRWRLEYAVDLFDRSTAERMLAHLETLLEAALADPNRPAADLPLLTTAERDEIVSTWNATSRVWPDAAASSSLVAWLDAQAARTPDAAAVWAEDGVRTYAELHACANRIARRLQRLGVGAESRVAVWVERSPALVAALVGVLKAGGAYVPLDPSYPAARLAFQVADAQAAVVLTTGAWVGAVPPGPYAVEVLDAPDAAWRGETATAPAVQIEPAQLAYIIYTSGSTGQPKGAMNTHRGVANRLAWMQATYALTADDKVLQKTSSSFDVSSWELWWPLGTGAGLVLAQAGGQNDPAYLAELIARTGVTVAHFVPAMLEAFVAAGGLASCDAVRLLVTSGEALPGELAERCLAAWPGRLENLYGPTEAAIDVTQHSCRPDDAAAAVPIGKPIANTQMYAVDPTGQPVPLGVRGELAIGGVQVGRGYWRRPDLTADRFVPNPFADTAGERLYRTGDVGRYRPGGVLEFVGRTDHQVKLHGNRIELGEIEARLRRLPAIRDAAVLMREDRPGERRLVAYAVAARAGEVLASDVVKQALRADLPEYMLPAVIVTLDALPLSANGKIDRRALPRPTDERPALSETYAAPRTDTEATLARIWAQVLRLERVGIHDNFFALGGDSILGLQALARAQDAGVQLTPRQLFQHQTIADLALVATTARRSGPPSSREPDEIDDRELPLTPIQRWFFEQDSPAPHHFNQSVLLAGGPSFPWIAWDTIVAAVVAHHDALRLRFTFDGARWSQRHAAHESHRVFIQVDLGAMGDRSTSVVESTAARVQRSLHLGEGPLVRVVLFRAATPSAERLFIVVHHAVIDGVSWRILLEDLYRASAQWPHGMPIQLPDKTASFRRWAQHLERAASTEDPAAGAYWEAIDARQQQMRLPRDLEAGRNSIGSQRTVTVALTAEETHAFLQMPPRAYRMQAHEVLIAAAADALTAWMGTSDAMLALEGHGRDPLGDEELNLSRTVGCFTSIFPVWLRLPNDGPDAILMAVKEQLRRAPRRGIEYGLWRYGAGRTNTPRATPEVLVNYLGQFDQVLDEAGSRLAPERMGLAQHPAAERPFVLELNGGVTGDRLGVTISYSTHLHRPDTIAAFADAFAARLRALIAHCRGVPWTRTTPSDVPLAPVTQHELDALGGIGGEIENVYPLSPMQEGLLFHALFDPRGAVYFQQVRVTLEGDLDIDAFRRAWSDVVARHAILRTAFAWQARERPVQVAYARVALECDIQDLRGLRAAERAARLAASAEADLARGFRLDRVPLMRLAVVRLGEREWEVIWSYHHILLDGWCVPLVFGEVTWLYEAHRTGRPAVLPPVARFSDYISWLQSQDGGRAEAYWRGVLKGFREATPFLPARETTAPEADHDGYSRRERRIADQTVAGLHALARQHQVTVNTIVQGAWAVLLARYARTRDVVFGATSSGRPASLAGVESMVGLFVSTLPVRVDVDFNAPALPWLRALQAAQAEARQYEYTPLVDIQGWSELPGGVPLFDSLLAFENYPVNDELVRGTASFRIVDAQVFEKTNYPITVQVSPASGLSIRILFDSRRVDAAAVERMLAHTDMLLSAVASDCETRLGDLPLLSAAERLQVLAEWNPPPAVATRLAADAPPSLLDALERQALARPDAIAVVCEGRALSYAALHRRANQLAHVLRAEGVGPEVPVAVCVGRGLELLVALLGVWKAGGAYVPLDLQAPSARLPYLVSDAGAPVIVTTSALRDRMPAEGLRCVCLDADRARLDAAPADRPSSHITSETLAYVIYTSGSTGQPKGVGVTHGNLASLFAATEPLFGLSAADTWTLFHSAAFDFSVWEMWGALAYGGRLIVVPTGVPRMPDAFAALVRAEGVTVLNQTPSAFRSFQTIAADDPPLRLVIFGGEALAFESLRPWTARHGLDRPELVNMYGITETTVHVTHHRLGPRDVAPGASSRIGRAIPSLQLYILDPAQQPAPLGVVGEIYVGGAGVARGYLGRPDLTATRFVPDPFATAPGARLYRAGDLARWRADGTCEFLGRADHQVKLRGYRIEPGEIEASLREQPGIRDAVVQLREDAPGERRLVAYVVADAAAGAHDPDAAPREWERRQVSQWEAVFERSYAPGPPAADPTLNITGWNSSITGAPIPEHEMRDWVDETVSDIAALRPSRVLEIGCGTGLLLLRLAPLCREYRGTDISRTALDYIERQLPSLPATTRVTLRHQAADDFASIADQRYDAIVLNSVVQYFPSADYLARVLERAAQLLTPGGAIYVGDIQSLPLRRTFHRRVQFQQAPGWLQPRAFERRVERQLHQEEELVIAPAFFFAIADQLPAIAHVEIAPKRGRASNEMTMFRYQAILRCQSPDETSLEVAWTDWTRDALSLDAIARRLADDAPAAFGVVGLPNARLQDDLALARALAAADEQTVLDELRVQVYDGASTVAPGVHPQDVLAVARGAGYEAILDWSRHDGTGAFDVIFRRRDVAGRWPGWPREVVARDGVAATNSPSLGQAGRRLALALRQGLEQRLPAYMVPSSFVLLERLPTTSNGKLDRKALPPPDFARPELEQAYVAPRTPLEAELAQVWADVLRVQQVGIHDNFFELGGDSIISIQLVARAVQAGMALTPKLLFDRPTIAHIAAALAEGAASGAGGGEPGATDDPSIAFPPAGLTRDELQRAMKGGPRVEDAYPLSSMQEGMLFHTVSAPDSGVYVAQLRYVLNGELDPQALRQAWQHTVDRHPALRTGFLWDRAARPLQVVCAGVDVLWEERDWRGLAEADARARLAALVDADRARRFDLAAPPLMRVTLIRTGNEQWEVLWSHHHLLLDGWSLPIVTQDVIRSYAAYRHGTHPQLEPPVPYRAYIAWLQRQDLRDAERFWRQALAGVSRPTPLALSDAAAAHDRGRPMQRHLRLRLGARRTAAIKAWVRARHVTLNTLLQALWALVVSRLSGERDVVFGGVVSGRPPTLAGSERAVGLFINTLPVRVQVPDEAELVTWLAALQAQQAAERQYEFVPLVTIRTWSAVPGDMPLFDTLLVFENFPSEVVAGVDMPGLRIDRVHYEMTESHPVVLAVAPGAQLGLEFKYDRRRIEPSRVQRIRAMVEAALDTVAGGGAGRVSDLVQAMDRAERDRHRDDEALTEKTAADLLRTVKRAAVTRRGRSEVDDGSGTPTPRT